MLRSTSYIFYPSPTGRAGFEFFVSGFKLIILAPRSRLYIPAKQTHFQDFFVFQGHGFLTRENRGLQTHATEFSEKFIFFIVTSAATYRQLSVYNRKSWCNQSPISKGEEF